MKSNNIRRLCAGAALVATAFGAQAAIMNLSDWANGHATVNVTYPQVSNLGEPTSILGGTYGGEAGGFKGKLTDAGRPDLPSGTFDINTYCIQLGEYFNWNTNFTYNVVSPVAQYFEPFGAARAAGLTRLFNYVYAKDSSGKDLFEQQSSAGGRATLSAAVQLAVWEIRYESDGAPTWDLRDGAFRSNVGSATGTVYARANELLLSSASSSSIGLDLFVLQSSNPNGKQDQVFWRPKSVPEPGSVTLALLAFAAAGVATTRRRSRA